jgi:hypothetical protein
MFLKSKSNSLTAHPKSRLGLVKVRKGQVVQQSLTPWLQQPGKEFMIYL